MKSLALIALFLATQAHAAGDWLLVAESDIAKSYVKVGSIELGLNDSNEPIVFGTFRLVTKQRQVLLGREYVKLADCRRGYGKLVSTTLDGTYQFQNDFIFDGENVAAEKAQLLCGVASAAFKSSSPEPSTQPSVTYY